MITLRVTLSLSLTCLTSAALAQHHHHHHHGAASLTFVSSAGDLALELHAPASDLLGFEHLPKTAAEEAHWAEVAQLLSTPTLFGLTDCTLLAQDSALVPEGGHASIVANYTFTCSAAPVFEPSAFFTAFANLESLEVEGLVDGAATKTKFAP